MIIQLQKEYDDKSQKFVSAGAQLIDSQLLDNDLLTFLII